MTANLHFNDESMTGSELELRGAKLAGGLTELGLQEGDAIAVLLQNVPAYADVMMSCRIGGFYHCAINWHFRTAEIDYLLQDSSAKALIVEASLLAEAEPAIPEGMPVLVVGSANTRYPEYEHWLSNQESYNGPSRAPRGLMPYTSGTTGKPKGVVRHPLQPSHLETMKQLSEQTWGVKPGVRSLVAAPLYHSAPNSFTLQSLLYGKMLVLMQKFDPETLLQLIEKHRITTVYLVPVMYVRLLRLPEEVRQKYDISSVTFVASTGAPCPPDIKTQMISWWGDVIYETYASSETGMLTVQDPEGARTKPGSAGRPVLNAIIKIYREDGSECEVDEIGIIYGRQPAIPDFTYQNNSQARKKIGRGELVTVGDMGYLDKDGYLFVCDRMSDMVISGGVNIYPAETENVIMQLDGVVDCAVFGVPDQEFGEALLALIQLTKDSSLDTATIEKHLRGQLAGYKVPKTLKFTETLPRDDNGKVAKRKLKEQYWQNAKRKI